MTIRKRRGRIKTLKLINPDMSIIDMFIG